jgi:hypothetical protein
MANTEKKIMTAEQANDAMHALSTTGDEQSISFEQAFDLVDKADTSKMTDLTLGFFEFEKNKEYTVFVKRLFKTTVKERETEVVEFLDRNKTPHMSGAAVLVNAVKKLTTIPCFIKIKCNGKTKGTEGSYYDLEITTFTGNVK